MKLCKDCKHFAEASDKEAFCLHEQAVKFDDPIYGLHTKRTCHEMRIGNPHGPDAICGRFGKLWVAKPGFSVTNFQE
jgi:hypothetical protein